MKSLGRPGLVLGKAWRVTPPEETEETHKHTNLFPPEETHKPAECWEPPFQDAPKSVKLSLKSSGSTGGGRAQPGAPEPNSNSSRWVIPALPLADPRFGPGDSGPLREGCGGSLGDLRKAAWLRRKGPALASPHSFYGPRPTTLLSLSGLDFLFCEMGRGNGVPWRGLLWKYPELSPGKMQVWPQGPCSTEPVCSHVCAWVLGSIWVGTELWACDLERWGLLWERKWARPVVVRERRTHFL